MKITCAKCGSRVRATGPCKCKGTGWLPRFESWRHGGWYVTNLHYPSGAVGCVAKRDDGRWMIACDRRENPPTFRNRTDAALAEREIVLAEGGSAA